MLHIFQFLSLRWDHYFSLSSCWIGPGADQLSIEQKLGNQFDSDKDHIVCLCAVGYKSNYIPLFIRIFNSLMSRRLPLSELFYADSDFKQPLNISRKQFAPYGRNFEICQMIMHCGNTKCICINGTKNMTVGLDISMIDLHTKSVDL